MELTLQDFFKLTDEQRRNSKIEITMVDGPGGEQYLKKWLLHSDYDKEEGLCTDCSYWGWYGGQRNFYPGNLAFSFVRMPVDDEWLLISAAKIKDVPPDSRSVYTILDEYKPYFGRLIIKYVKGHTFGRWVFNYDKIAPTATIKELLPCLYSGKKFEGYDHVNLRFDELKAILDGKMMPTYREALERVTGVYCLTDTSNGKLYIGSAYSEGGIAQRWGNYLDSKHGDNVRLIELYKNKGEAYFEKHFTFTLLEYYGLAYDPNKIIERESYWKDCLGTRDHGYNGN